MMCAIWSEKQLSESFGKRQGTIADNIIWLAQKYPSVLSDYRKLIQYYWYYINNLNVFVPMNILEGLAQPESIGRAFRKLVADGVLIVDDTTKKVRLQEQQNYHDYYRRKQK